MTFDDIKRQGAVKYFEDHGSYRNPHPWGSTAFNEFERGWMQSLKRDGARLVQGSRFKR